ncbi:hemolysin XhlA family protein [Cytobacillus sp. FSL K6-0129]|uniref:hemolysin XhlA family protein n=1 Tax=Cytobacillus sp. FSL K6-0129 TaxID=2921421 RepID=UPI0030FB7881
MAEPSGHELNEKIADIREWLVRIDTKMDNLNDIKRLAERADEKADSAEDKADFAIKLAEEVRDDIRDMKANTKWVWGTLLTVAGLLVTVFIALIK